MLEFHMEMGSKVHHMISHNPLIENLSTHKDQGRETSGSRGKMREFGDGRTRSFTRSAPEGKGTSSTLLEMPWNEACDVKHAQAVGTSLPNNLSNHPPFFPPQTTGNYI